MDTFFLFIVENFIAFSLLLIFISLLIIHESRKGGKKIDPTEVTRLINKEEGLVIDLRSSAEYLSGHITGAQNIEPQRTLDQILSLKTPKEKPIILVCKTGSSSRSVGGELKKNGYLNINIMSGGMLLWQNQGLPLSK